ncbi:MAG: hypothetical protein ACLUGP_07520 [Faecalibacterium prausnitzii]
MTARPSSCSALPASCFGIVISWLDEQHRVAHSQSRTARRRHQPQVAGKKKGIKTMDLILVIIGVSLVWFHAPYAAALYLKRPAKAS